MAPGCAPRCSSRAARFVAPGATTRRAGPPEPQVLHAANGDRVAGRSYRADELATLLNRQAPLLADGGVSFSGGEPLMQAAFLEAVLERLEGLHVVLGTSAMPAPRISSA